MVHYPSCLVWKGAGQNSSQADACRGASICVSIYPSRALPLSLPARGERAGERGPLNRRTPAAKNFVLRPVGNFSVESSCAPDGRWVINALFFDSSWMALPSRRSQRWEAREIRARLRHCDGLQSSRATGSAKRSREGGSEVRNPKVRTSAWLYARRVPPSRDRFSVKEKDEASPLQLFFSGS